MVIDEIISYTCRTAWTKHCYCTYCLPPKPKGSGAGMQETTASIASTKTTWGDRDKVITEDRVLITN